MTKPVRTHTERLESISAEIDGSGFESDRENGNVTSDVHVPQWDILDTDFDWFPQLPNFESKTTDMENNPTDLLSNIYLFKESHAELFFLSIGLLIAVVLGTIGLFVWLFCCKDTEMKRNTLVIEHPHFEDRNELVEGSGTPLRNITPMELAIASTEDIGSSMSSISLSGFYENPNDIPKPTLRLSKVCRNRNETTEL